MANQQQLQNLGNAIGYIAVADIKGLRNLLSKYGVVNVGSDSKTLIAETTNLVSNSRFYNELVSLIQSNVSEASFSGYNNIGGRTPVQSVNTLTPQGVDLSGMSSISNTSSTNASGSKGGFFSGFNIGDLLGTGASIYGNIQADKRQKDLLNAQANQQAQQTQSQILAGQLALETEKLKLAQIQAGKEQGSSSNTLLYVGLGVLGVAVIGGIIYAVAKK